VTGRDGKDSPRHWKRFQEGSVRRQPGTRQSFNIILVLCNELRAGTPPLSPDLRWLVNIRYLVVMYREREFSGGNRGRKNFGFAIENGFLLGRDNF